MTPLLLSVPDAAKTLAISVRAFYRLIDSRQIETVHIGRAVRIPAPALEAFVEQLRAAS